MHFFIIILLNFHIDLSTTEKGKIYSDYLTLSTMNVSNDNSQHHHLARAHHHQAEIYPFELTDSCTGNNGSNKNEQTVTAEFAANNFQLLLSHQQVSCRCLIIKQKKS